MTNYWRRWEGGDIARFMKAHKIKQIGRVLQQATEQRTIRKQVITLKKTERLKLK